jgi:hypothetical protein
VTAVSVRTAFLGQFDQPSWAERADPVGHAMHVAAVIAWGVSQTISNAAEGITWGILLAITILRLPKIWRCFGQPLGDGLWRMLAAWVAWTALSVLWGPDFPPGEGPAAFHRWILTPLMLWPVMARPWIPLAAIAMGGVVQMIVTIVMSKTDGGWHRYQGILSPSRFTQLLWHVHCTAVLSVALVRALPWPAAPLGVVGIAVSGFVWYLSSSRMMLVATAMGSLVVAVRARPRSRISAWRMAGIMAAVAALIAGAVALTPAGTRLASIVRDARSAEGVEQWATAISADRYTLVRAATDIALQSPFVGAGRGAFRAGLASWCTTHEASEPRIAKRLAVIRAAGLNDAHNVIFQNWADGGIPGAVLITVPIFWLGWRLWRQSAGSLEAAAALGLYMAILVGAFLQPITIKAPGAIIAVALAVSWSPRARAGSR